MMIQSDSPNIHSPTSLQQNLDLDSRVVRGVLFRSTLCPDQIWLLPYHPLEQSVATLEGTLSIETLCVMLSCGTVQPQNLSPQTVGSIPSVRSRCCTHILDLLHPVDLTSVPQTTSSDQCKQQACTNPEQMLASQYAPSGGATLVT